MTKAPERLIYIHEWLRVSPQEAKQIRKVREQEDAELRAIFARADEDDQGS